MPSVRDITFLNLCLIVAIAGSNASASAATFTLTTSYFENAPESIYLVLRASPPRDHMEDLFVQGSTCAGRRSEASPTWISVDIDAGADASCPDCNRLCSDTGGDELHGIGNELHRHRGQLLLFRLEFRCRRGLLFADKHIRDVAGHCLRSRLFECSGSAGGGPSND
jgi:hypothetical protein